MWWLLACRSFDALLAPPPLPAVQVHAVTDTGVISIHLDFSGAPPGTRYRLYVSEVLTPRRCAAGIQPCVPLASPWLLASGPAEPDLWLTGQPTPVAGTLAWAVLTAVGPRGQTMVAAPVSFVVQSGAADGDGDGATLDAELLAGTDPTRPDSDGGGEWDGSELDMGRDPTQPGDDVVDEGSCADGIDGDHDGLLDCEDSSCVGDPACDEQDCRDGLDGDLDGLTDCEDEDCWNGRCASSTIAWVVSGRVSHRTRSDWSWGTRSAVWAARAVSGRVRLDYGPSQRTCTWTIGDWGHTRSDVRTPNGWIPATEERPWSRSGGFRVEGGCRVDERLLPAASPALFNGAWYGAEVHSRSYLNPPWGGGATTMVHSASEAHRRAAPRGVCADGRRPIEAWRDMDGDGYGALRHGGVGDTGGRWMVCPPLTAGFVARPGDCDDHDPTWNPADAWRPEPMGDCEGVSAIDRDGDGAPVGVDRNDLDGFPLCPGCRRPWLREDCLNNVDDDGDQLADCEDWDCLPWALCTELDCTDGLDGMDHDGLRDCADPDCRSGCGERQCSDGSDDDGDALVDCEDADCAFGPACAELVCDNQRDDDADGLVDCADEDCWSARCHDVTIAWAITARFQSTYDEPLRWSSRQTAEDVVGRVRVEGPDVGVQTCTWTVDRATRGVSVPLAASWQYRRGFQITPGCRVGPEVLPPLEAGLWGGYPWPVRPWYSPVRDNRDLFGGVPGTTWSPVTIYKEGGPVLHPSWEGQCADGSDPVLVYTDADGDGFGVSEPRDMHGDIGGRRFICGVMGPGLTRRGGDCDDGDPTWTPEQVVTADGVSCERLSPHDRDGDGVRRGADIDDEQALVH